MNEGSFKENDRVKKYGGRVSGLFWSKNKKIVED